MRERKREREDGCGTACDVIAQDHELLSTRQNIIDAISVHRQVSSCVGVPSVVVCIYLCVHTTATETDKQVIHNIRHIIVCLLPANDGESTRNLLPTNRCVDREIEPPSTLL